MTHIFFGILVVLALAAFGTGILLLLFRRIRTARIFGAFSLILAGAALVVVGLAAAGLAAKLFFWTAGAQMAGIGVGVAWQTRQPKKTRKFMRA